MVVLSADMEPKNAPVVGRHGVFSEQVVSQGTPFQAIARMTDTKGL